MGIELPDLGFRPTLGCAIRHCVEYHGDREFLISESERWTYAQIEQSSARVARRMLASGIGKGSRVGLYFTYSREWVVYWLAASRIGAIVVPLSTIYAPQEIGRVLRLSDVAVLIAPSQLLGRDVADTLEVALPGLAWATSGSLRLQAAPFLRSIWMIGKPDRPWALSVDIDAEPTPEDPDENLLAAIEDEVTPADLAIVVFTSGSSATPKGVVHTHGSILWQSSAHPAILRKRAGDLPPVILCGMPFFWVGGILTLGISLLGQIPLVIMEKFDALGAMKLIQRERVTALMGWPTMTQNIVNHPEVSKFDLSSAPTIRDNVDVAMVDVPLPGVPAHRGMSETLGTFVCVETRVIDPLTGQDAAMGEDGELLVRGPGLMDGYYKRPRHEVVDENGWLHTGDKVVRIEGDKRNFFRGRYTEMIKCAGANVAPREVESVIEEFDDVVHCFVVGVPDPVQGEAVAAIVVLTGEAERDSKSLEKRTREKLSAYKVPRIWHFIESGDIPWLGSGKPDKLSLRNRFSTVNPK